MDFVSCFRLVGRSSLLNKSKYEHIFLSLVSHILDFGDTKSDRWIPLLDDLDVKLLLSSPIFLKGLLLLGSARSSIRRDKMHYVVKLFSKYEVTDMLTKYYESLINITRDISFIEWSTLMNLNDLDCYNQLQDVTIHLGFETIKSILKIKNPKLFWDDDSLKIILKSILKSICLIMKKNPSIFTDEQKNFAILVKLLTFLDHSSSLVSGDSSLISKTTYSSHSLTQPLHNISESNHSENSLPINFNQELKLDYFGKIYFLLISLIQKNPVCCHSMTLQDTLAQLSSVSWHVLAIHLSALHALLQHKHAPPTLQQPPQSQTRSLPSNHAKPTDTVSRSRNKDVSVHSKSGASVTSVHPNSKQSNNKVLLAGKGSGEESLTHRNATDRVKSSNDNSGLQLSTRIKSENDTLSVASTTSKQGLGHVHKVVNPAKAGRTSKSTGPSVETVITELCKSGQLRHICWAMISPIEFVRMTAFGILKRIECHLFPSSSSISEAPVTFPSSSGIKGTDGGDQTSTSTSPSITSVDTNFSILQQSFTLAFIEQGLVPLLELLRTGFRIQDIRTHEHSLDRYPELSIRTFIHNLLHRISMTMTTQIVLRNQSLSSLRHAGQFRLRLNLLSSFLFLIGRQEELGRLLWEESAAVEYNTIHSEPGLLFKDSIRLCVIECQRGNLKPLISLLAHMYHMAWTVRRSQRHFHRKQSQGTASHPEKRRTSLNNSKASSDIRDKLEGGPVVAVAEIAGSTLVKMRCPAPAAVRPHSAELATLLEDIMTVQTQTVTNLEALRSTKSSDETVNTIASPTPVNIDIDSLPRLEGSYLAWQELFSHTLDDFLLDTSIGHLSTPILYDLYSLASRFHMKKLRSRYSKELNARLSVKTVLQIFWLGLGRYDKSFTSVDDLVGKSSRFAPTHLLSQTKENSQFNTDAQKSLLITIKNSKIKLNLHLCGTCLTFLCDNLDAVYVKNNSKLLNEIVELLNAILVLIMK